MGKSLVPVTAMLCVVGLFTFNGLVYGDKYLLSVVRDGHNGYVLGYAGQTSGWIQLQTLTQQTINPYTYNISKIDNSWETTSGRENKSLSVNTSGDNIRVLAGYNYIAFSLLPISALGSKYIVSSCHPSGNYMSLLVIATHRHQTDVDITFTLDGAVTYDGTAYRNGDTLSLSLLEYQTFTIKSNFDLSGTVINTTQTVAVFSGTMYGTIVVAYEQLLPVKHFGQEYVVAVDDDPALYILQVVSERNDTQIMFNNGSTVSVDKNGLYRQTLTQNASLIISTTWPVMTTLCRKNGNNSDLVVVPPVVLYIKQTAFHYFTTFKVLTHMDTDSVVVKRNSEGNIPGQWHEISGSSYKVGTWILDRGYVSIVANASFTTLLFHFGTIYNGGYKFMECDSDHYGPNCTGVCVSRHCKGSSSCSPSTGECDGGCETGWKRPDCIECDSDHYGPNCTGVCVSRHCKGSSSCSPSTGECNGGCETGWKGLDCIECDSDHYGPNCTGVCVSRHCKGSSSCSPSTGECDGGCETGWKGPDCIGISRLSKCDDCIGNGSYWTRFHCSHRTGTVTIQ